LGNSTFILLGIQWQPVSFIYSKLVLFIPGRTKRPKTSLLALGESGLDTLPSSISKYTCKHPRELWVL
jgi:hypothetical protein